jgi:hypothetical protein
MAGDRTGDEAVMSLAEGHVSGYLQYPSMHKSAALHIFIVFLSEQVTT